ncbi:hypothetical protein H4582DRAFT_2104390 [Lactarius indigo]|nr:hypothetical protein H4582DRAFT_2104390 [Lactarius indigo]
MDRHAQSPRHLPPTSWIRPLHPPTPPPSQPGQRGLHSHGQRKMQPTVRFFFFCFLLTGHSRIYHHTRCTQGRRPHLARLRRAPAMQAATSFPQPQRPPPPFLTTLITKRRLTTSWASAQQTRYVFFFSLFLFLFLILLLQRMQCTSHLTSQVLATASPHARQDNGTTPSPPTAVPQRLRLSTTPVHGDIPNMDARPPPQCRLATCKPCRDPTPSYLGSTNLDKFFFFSFFFFF